MEVQELLFIHTFEVPMEAIMEMMLTCRSSLPTTFRHFAEGESFTQLLVKDQIQRVIAGISDLAEHVQQMTLPKIPVDAD